MANPTKYNIMVDKPNSEEIVWINYGNKYTVDIQAKWKNANQVFKAQPMLFTIYTYSINCWWREP